MVGDESANNETETVEKIWTAYKIVMKYSLDKLFSQNDYSRGNWASMTDYVESLLCSIEKKLEQTEAKLHKMKNSPDSPFSAATKKIFIVLLENIELRKVLCECNRTILGSAPQDNETKN